VSLSRSKDPVYAPQIGDIASKTLDEGAIFIEADDE
jgi:hypothetical protein